MFTLEPQLAVFLNLLSLGMSLILLMLLQLPGERPIAGKIIIGIHVISYLISMGMDIPSHFAGSTILTRLIAGVIFWTGPSLLWISRWGRKMKILTVKNSAINLILFLLLEYFLIWHSDTFFQPVYKGSNFTNIIIFIWIILNGSIGLWKLSKRKSSVVTAARICIIFLISAGLLWGFLTGLKNTTLGFTIGLTIIPIILLTAQGMAAFSGNKRKAPIETDAIISEFRMSPREAEVFIKVAKGWGNKDIARELGISENTVKRHMNALFKKCGVDSRFKLAALSNGWNQVNAP